YLQKTAGNSIYCCLGHQMGAEPKPGSSSEDPRGQRLSEVDSKSRATGTRHALYRIVISRDPSSGPELVTLARRIRGPFPRCQGSLKRCSRASGTELGNLSDHTNKQKLGLEQEFCDWSFFFRLWCNLCLFPAGG